MRLLADIIIPGHHFGLKAESAPGSEAFVVMTLGFLVFLFIGFGIGAYVLWRRERHPAPLPRDRPLVAPLELRVGRERLLDVPERAAPERGATSARYSTVRAAACPSVGAEAAPAGTRNAVVAPGARAMTVPPAEPFAAVGRTTMPATEGPCVSPASQRAESAGMSTKIVWPAAVTASSRRGGSTSSPLGPVIRPMFTASAPDPLSAVMAMAPRRIMPSLLLIVGSFSLRPVPQLRHATYGGVVQGTCSASTSLRKTAVTFANGAGEPSPAIQADGWAERRSS